MFGYVLTAVVTILLFCYRYAKAKNYKFPRGPFGIPIVGNLLQVTTTPHLQFSKWAYKYGKLYTINLLGQPALVVNDPQLMKQVFGTTESTGGFRFKILDHTTDGPNGIFSADGKEWLEIRTFTMKALDECGFSQRSVIEPTINLTCEDLIDWLQTETKNSCVVVPFRAKFICSISNTLWSILSRSGPNCKSSDIGNLVVNIIDAMQATMNSGLIFLPWLKYIVPERSGYNGYIKACEDIHAQVDKYFYERNSHRKQFKIEPKERNLLDAYLDQCENCTDPNSVFCGQSGWKPGFYSLVMIFIVGGEATGTMLNWIINYLVAYPLAQEKLYEELQENYRNGETPSLADTKKLPYLEAFIYEALRKASIVPFGSIQRLLDDIHFEGYHLPKNTLLVANIYHVHNNRAVWGDPENFRPERFLEVGGLQSRKLKENVVSFQAGKRICPGENLAKDLLFLATARLVQNFQFLPAPRRALQDYIKPIVGYLLLPNQIGIVVKPRQNFKFRDCIKEKN